MLGSLRELMHSDPDAQVVANCITVLDKVGTQRSFVDSYTCLILLCDGGQLSVCSLHFHAACKAWPLHLAAFHRPGLSEASSTEHLLYGC